MKDNFNELLSELTNYSPRELSKIKSAYQFADLAHAGQFRCSGEPYICHPISVAIILAKMNADSDTICAGLLHDVIEDTSITYDDIKNLFNEDIANLVDGVTKMSSFRFSTKEEMNLANTRKIITSITKDVRIIIIKLADRLHNMSTMDFKPIEKQKENSFETLHIFAPIAGSIGAYQIKNQLEDLSIKYLEPDKYKQISDERSEYYEKYNKLLTNVSKEIVSILSNNNIPCEVKERVKSIYSIFKKEREGNSFNSIQDLLSLSVIVDEVINCYNSLYYIHSLYNPLNYSFRDYISRPGVNKYKSLHTTVFVRDNTLLQAQIRTNEMDKLDNMGICSYWELFGHNSHKKMQKDLKKDFPFYSVLSTFNDTYNDDQEFMFHTEAELLSSKIFVYNSNGEVVELPYGSTIEKYLINQGMDINDIEECYVNGKKVNKKKILKDSDIIFVKLKQQKGLKLLLK